MHSYRKFSVDSLPNIFRTFGDLLHPLSLILFYDNYLINEDDQIKQFCQYFYLIMMKKIVSSQDTQALPVVDKKKSGAQIYVSERLRKIRQQRSKQTQQQKKTRKQIRTSKRKKAFRNILQEAQRDQKKNIIVSPNKIISNEQLMASIEPFRKELDFLRKKSSSTIDYEELLSNLHPFSNAIRELGIYKIQAENAKKFKRNVSENSASVNLYRSMPKKKNLREQLKPISQTYIKRDEGYFLNVQRIQLLDNEKHVPRKYENYHSAFGGSQKQLQYQPIQFIHTQKSGKNEISYKFLNKKQEQYLQENLSQKKLQYGQEKEEKRQNNFSFSPQKKKKKFNVPFETYYYRNLLWKINFTNGLNVEVPSQYEHRLRIYIGKGNNSSLVRGVIKRRIWFAFTDRIEEANFVWTQLKSLPYLKLQKHSDNGNEQKQTKPVYLANSIMVESDKSEMKKYLQIYQTSEQKTDERLLSKNKFFRYSKTIKINEIKQTKMHNHLINNYVIGNKKALFHTMNAYYTQIGEDVFDYLPLSFHIRQGLQDPVYFKFLKYFYKRGKEIKVTNQTASKKDKEYNAWIVKPGQNSNRGNGIKVCLNLQQIKTIVKKKQRYNDGSFKTYIVQNYIERPLLYHKRKFDIRHYMMMTCVNGNVKGYWYQDGYLRTTSTEYNLSTNCGKVHLTNDAVQKNLPDYGKYEKGNKLSYDELQTYIQKNYKKNSYAVSFKKVILPRMKKIATDTMRACSMSIDPQKRQNNFEIFGLDFMIDSHFKLYLLQVNSNPCLQISCPMLGAIIPKMIENALELTLDSHFPPPVRYYPKGVHYFKDLQKQNKFELVYDSRYEPTFKCSMNVLDAKLLQEEDDTFEDDGQEFEWED